MEVMRIKLANWYLYV